MFECSYIHMASERVIVLRDSNAREGRNSSNFAKIFGKFGENIFGIGNRKRLLNSYQTFSNSSFKHKNLPMNSWENPGQNRKSLLDYVIVDEYLRKMVLNTRVYRSFGLDSDHYFVANALNQV